MFHQCYNQPAPLELLGQVDTARAIVAPLWLRQYVVCPAHRRRHLSIEQRWAAD